MSRFPEYVRAALELSLAHLRSTAYELLTVSLPNGTV